MTIECNLTYSNEKFKVQNLYTVQHYILSINCSGNAVKLVQDRACDR